jgi:hypothetical protein
MQGNMGRYLLQKLWDCVYRRCEDDKIRVFDCLFKPGVRVMNGARRNGSFKNPFRVYPNDLSRRVLFYERKAK